MRKINMAECIILNTKVTSPVEPSAKLSVCLEVDSSNDGTIKWLKDPESFSKTVQQFLEDHLGKDTPLNLAPLRDRAGERWPDINNEVIDCVLWVGLECARMGVTIGPSVWMADNGNAGDPKAWQLYSKMMKGIIPSYVIAQKNLEPETDSADDISTVVASKNTRDELEPLEAGWSGGSSAEDDHLHGSLLAVQLSSPTSGCGDGTSGILPFDNISYAGEEIEGGRETLLNRLES